MIRLLNLDTLKLETFFDDASIPPYVILSHTWGNGEVKFEDLEDLPRDKLDTMPGWAKIVSFCGAAKSHTALLPDPVQYGWVDSCCIDKRHSAELTEAINSMFRWYRDAVACFVLLPDMTRSELDTSDSFEKSRWFTRGWTLQELLAPQLLYFFDKDWEYVSDKENLAERISETTRIDIDVVYTGSWDDMSVAQRMSWASNRTTTRKEDIAYCMLGIFDISMPIIYGEGDKAFLRLQEEILKDSADQSILAWDASTKDSSLRVIGALATSPAQFHSSDMIESLPSDWNPATITARGIQAHLPIISQELAQGGTRTVALLSCRYSYDISTRVGIPVTKDGISSSSFVRTSAAPMSIPLQMLYMKTPPAVFLQKRDRKRSAMKRSGTCWVQFMATDHAFGPVRQGLGPGWHLSSARSLTLKLRRHYMRNGGVSYIVLPFQHSRFDDILYVVLRLDNSSGAGKIGLRVLKHDVSMVKDEVEKMRALADSIALGPQEDIRFEPLRKVFATIGTSPDDPSVFKVVISQRSI